MSSRRLIDHDPESGVSTYHHYDHSTETTAIETVQDVASYLRRAKVARDDPGYTRKGIRESMWHVASVPVGVQLEWMTKYGVDMHRPDHKPGVMRLLRSAEYSYLRTTTGRF